jgi:hypothetical protein
LAPLVCAAVLFGPQLAHAEGTALEVETGVVSLLRHARGPALGMSGQPLGGASLSGGGPTPASEPLVASFAWRTSSGFRWGHWRFGDAFDYNPLALVAWRLDGGFAPRLGRFIPSLGIAAGAGMFFDFSHDQATHRLRVTGLAYVAAEIGGRFVVWKYLTLGVSLGHTLASTRDLWMYALTIGLDGPIGTGPRRR